MKAAIAILLVTLLVAIFMIAAHLDNDDFARVSEQERACAPSGVLVFDVHHHPVCVQIQITGAEKVYGWTK